MDKYLKYVEIIIGIIIVGIIGYYIYVYTRPNIVKDVSNLSVCNSHIMNGDTASVINQSIIVNGQLVKVLSGRFVITDVTGMQNYAKSLNECNETVSYFIKTHPEGNNVYWRFEI